MHLGHKRNPGQMLTETVMQILPDSALFSCTDVQNRFFQMFPFRDVDACGDNVIGGFSTTRQQRARPGDQSLISMPRYPRALIVVRKKIRAHDFKNSPEAVGLLCKKKQIPDTFA